ncbi:MAG: TIGR04283 family arsenosugar biosynthesis glycosyltransferase [Saprospiraceae bacterium]|nr:TIGR04283 family arsenosugar biosynthesis glycosyltransferase [Saprospiraceae bacterium]
MLLSVIIPVLNEAERIGSLVSYLRTHGGSSVLEILVIDAGSTDDTVREAQKSGATVLHSPVCSRAAQMNTGAKAAKGDVLYFVHADTCPPESFPLDIEKGLESGYQMGCYRYQFDSPGFLLKINAYFNRFHWLWCQGGDKTFFIRRNIFHDLGGYDEFYVIMEEYDFLRRAMPLFKLLIVPKYAVVSARKYERNGWFRVQFANMVVFNLFRLGVSPSRLKAVYKTILR